MPPDPLIASAFVQVLPEPKSLAAFPRTVKSQLTTELKKSPITVPVKVQLLAFKRDIATQLRQAAFTVPVEPVLAPNFRAKVEKLAGAAVAGLTVPVQIGAAGRPAGGTGTGTGAGRGETARQTTKTVAEQKLEKVIQARIVAEKALARVEAEVAGSEERATLATTARSKVQLAINEADKVSVSIGKTKFTGLATLVGKEQELLETLRQKAAAEKVATKATDESARADRRAASAAEARTTRATEAEVLRGRLAQVPSAGELATTPVAAARARLAEANATDRVAKSLLDQELAARKSLAAEGLLTKEALERSAALELELRSLQKATAAEVVRQRELTKTAIAESKAGQAAATRARQQEQALRGGGATILSRLGARGATLAAGGEFLAGAAIVTALGKSVDAAVKFETELNVLQATARATAAEMEAVSNRARELGADITLPAVGANDAAEAMTELSKAGLSIEDSMDAARGALQLATAAEIDNASATELVASGLNAFGLAGNQAIRVADLLTGSAIESQGSIADMGIALQQSAAVARQAGLTIEDTVALLTLLARNGLRGSDAGTSLRTSLIRLINPSKKAAVEIKRLGVEIRDINGNVRPEVYSDFADALANLSAKQRDATLAIIFGQDAIRAAAIFGREGADGLDAMREATQKQGLTAEIAGARTQGFAGQVEALKNELQNIGITLGGATLPLLSNFVETIEVGVGNVQSLIDKLQALEQALPGSGGEGGGGLQGFLDDLEDIGTMSFGDLVAELDAAQEVLSKRAGDIDPFTIESPRQALNRFNADIAETVDNAEELAKALSKIPAGGEGPVGNFVNRLREMREQILGSGEEANRLRDRIDSVIRLIVALGRRPSTFELQVLFEKGSIPAEMAALQSEVDRFTIGIKAGFARDSVVFLQSEAERAATQAADKAKNAFEQSFTLDPQLARALGFDFMFNVGEGAADAAGDAADKAATAFTQTLGTALAVAQAEGSESAELAILQQQLAATRARRARLEARFAKAPGPKLDEGIRIQAAEEERLLGEIERINNDRAARRKEAADNITKANNEADQAFLDALSLREGRLNNAILRAEGRAGVADDVKTHIALRDFFKRSIREAQKTIKDATTKAQVVQSLTTKLIQENQTIANLIRDAQNELDEILDLRVSIASRTGNVSTLRRLFATRLRQLGEALKEAIREAGKNSKLALELREEIEDTRQAAFDAINESFELDISFAETTGGEGAAVKAREAYIRQLQREQAFYKRGTLEWKRIRNEIAEQRKAISDARAEAGRMFSELAFQFLTTQQGFAANLLGNLLPGGAVAGTVSTAGAGTGSAALAKASAPTKVPGLPSPKVGDPGAVVGEQGRIATAESRGGFTAGQAATVIHLLQRMVILLGGIDTKGKHPEARAAQRKGGSSMDGMTY